MQLQTRYQILKIRQILPCKSHYAKIPSSLLVVPLFSTRLCTRTGYIVGHHWTCPATVPQTIRARARKGLDSTNTPCICDPASRITMRAAEHRESANHQLQSKGLSSQCHTFVIASHTKATHHCIRDILNIPRWRACIVYNNLTNHPHHPSQKSVSHPNAARHPKTALQPNEPLTQQQAPSIHCLLGSRKATSRLLHFFFAAPICVPCTLLPKSRLLRLSCQCACSGLRCNIISVRLLLPLAAVPPREDWRR